MLTGFLQPVLLTRALGREKYGVYAAVLSTVSILNNVVVAGSIQSMSRSVTKYGSPAIRPGVSMHLALGLLLSGAFALLAPLVGETFLRDPGLPPLLRIAAIVSGMYCVYAALVGALNGAQRFVAQATLDMIFATMRTGLIVGGAFVTHTVGGPVAGFAAASVAITLIAAPVVSRMVRESTALDLPAPATFAREYAGFFAPVLLYQFALNLVLQSDVLILQALASRKPMATLDGVKALVGVYKSAQNFAFLPYQLLIAVTFVLFPVVSKAAAIGDLETARTMLRGAMRFALVLLGAMLAVLAGLPRGVLRVAYTAEFSGGADALRALSIGQGFFSLSTLILTVLLAAHRTLATTSLMVFTLACVTLGDVLSITLTPYGEPLLHALALGTAAGSALGTLATGAYAQRVLGAFFPAKTALRATLAAVVASLFGSLLPLHSKPAALLAAIAVGGVYVVALGLSGELSADDRAAVRKRFGKK